MDAGTMIRTARRQAGLTQAELARRAGTSQATISAYESGRKDPSARTLLRLLAATGTQLTLAPGEYRVVQPTREDLRERGRILRQVLDFAETLPTRRRGELTYPRLGR